MNVYSYSLFQIIQLTNWSETKFCFSIFVGVVSLFCFLFSDCFRFPKLFINILEFCKTHFLVSIVDDIEIKALSKANFISSIYSTFSNFFCIIISIILFKQCCLILIGIKNIFIVCFRLKIKMHIEVRLQSGYTAVLFICTSNEEKTMNTFKKFIIPS